MKETEEFLRRTMPRYHAAETALHNGDPALRLAMWSRTEPLTVFGAAASFRGWSEIEAGFQWLGRSFSDCTSFENEIIAAGASGDLAYTVAIERARASVAGEPQQFQLRVTTVFRREDGEWKVVHRHGDPLQSEDGGAARQRLRATRTRAG